MNQAQKIDLMLENQIAIMKTLVDIDETTEKNLDKQLEKTSKALAPQSSEVGCEDDIKENKFKSAKETYEKDIEFNKEDTQTCSKENK